MIYVLMWRDYGGMFSSPMIPVFYTRDLTLAMKWVSFDSKDRSYVSIGEFKDD